MRSTPRPRERYCEGGGLGGGNAESYSYDLFLCVVLVFEGSRTYAYGDSINHDAERGSPGIDAALLLS